MIDTPHFFFLMPYSWNPRRKKKRSRRGIAWLLSRSKTPLGPPKKINYGAGSLYGGFTPEEYDAYVKSHPMPSGPSKEKEWWMPSGWNPNLTANQNFQNMWNYKGPTDVMKNAHDYLFTQKAYKDGAAQLFGMTAKEAAPYIWNMTVPLPGAGALFGTAGRLGATVAGRFFPRATNLARFGYNTFKTALGVRPSITKTAAQANRMAKQIGYPPLYPRPGAGAFPHAGDVLPIKWTPKATSLRPYYPPQPPQRISNFRKLYQQAAGKQFLAEQKALERMRAQHLKQEPSLVELWRQNQQRNPSTPWSHAVNPTTKYFPGTTIPRLAGKPALPPPKSAQYNPFSAPKPIRPRTRDIGPTGYRKVNLANAPPGSLARVRANNPYSPGMKK
ncbi:MAG: hypothetical protein [Cressdnaviricota sp.]|nr:MAG: hypothetical protein [Cressdnaviricota sp.]